MLVSEAGVFLALPVAWGLHESRSSLAVAVSLHCVLLERLGGDKRDCRMEQLEALGDIWFLSRERAKIPKAYRALQAALRWNGDATQLHIRSGQPGACQPVECVIGIQYEVYQEQGRYRIAWLGTQPGMPEQLSGDEARDQAERVNLALCGEPPPPQFDSDAPTGAEIPF